MSTKNTILKQYDGRFLQIFQEIYEQVDCRRCCLFDSDMACSQVLCCSAGCRLCASSTVLGKCMANDHCLGPTCAEVRVEV